MMLDHGVGRIGPLYTSISLISSRLRRSHVTATELSLDRVRGTADGCERWIGLLGHTAAPRGAAATALPAALATATSVIRVDEGRHLALSVLQHGAVIVFQQGASGV